ncbi:XRE family transcriptional regulator [Cellulomonas sp. 179-A 9B4 NHS]|uniref:XRE family transcriptional regulator n=1 Tax=Cellulomonas sp. 179-A 9B4 NHS TaxID=3142379 RepID=UPI00399F5300
MGSRRDVLDRVMRSTRTTQSQLSRLSGVHQPSISQFLSGRVEFSDDKLDHLLSCMGYRLEVVRRPVEQSLTRSERRSWLLHRQLCLSLTPGSLVDWEPVVRTNLERLRRSVTGEPHVRNLERWSTMISQHDVRGLRRVLTGLDRDSVAMREVSPLGGILSQEERSLVLASAS